jgi:hypothetical protein
MKNITDDDLTLLYYGEHDDPALAATVAGSTELSARFDALSAELGQIDALTPPQRADDYGSDVWQQISSRLADEPEKTPRKWSAWLTAARQPRFSWAGALSLVMVASLAFVLGRQGSQPEAISTPVVDYAPTMAQSGLNTERLLTRSVSGHLDQLNLAFTEFVNSTDATGTDAGQITDMLVANRLYRQAAISRGDHQLATFLSELEPVLIELAHDAHTSSSTSRTRMQQEIKDHLLFRIRVMNQQLVNPNIST